MIALAAPDLPLGQSGKFVAAAYAVVLVLILVYVAIMAVRAQRIERDLDELRRDVEAARGERPVDERRPADGSQRAAAAYDGESAPQPGGSGSLL